jgi:hypothetical protein
MKKKATKAKPAAKKKSAKGKVNAGLLAYMARKKAMGRVGTTGVGKVSPVAAIKSVKKPDKTAKRKPAKQISRKSFTPSTEPKNQTHTTNRSLGFI